MYWVRFLKNRVWRMRRQAGESAMLTVRTNPRIPSFYLYKWLQLFRQMQDTRIFCTACDIDNGQLCIINPTSYSSLCWSNLFKSSSALSYKRCSRRVSLFPSIISASITSDRAMLFKTRSGKRSCLAELILIMSALNWSSISCMSNLVCSIWLTHVSCF